MADNMRVSLSNGLVANNDSYSTSVNLPLTVPAGSGVLANDMNASGATAIVVNPPSNGQLDLLQSGGFAYTPNHGYVGVDSFTYVASLNGNQSNTATVKLMVQPLLSNLTVSPTTILGGQALQGTVFLSNPAPTGGSMVSLGSSSSALSVSQGVTISGGATSAVFPISSSSVGAKTPAIISASFFGTTKKVSVTLFPTPKLSSITVTPKSTAGGGTVVIRVTLSAAVPVGSVSISLASDSSALTVPATVSIASGKSNATLSVSCSPVSAPTTANITATLGGAKQTAAVSIQLPKILSLSASPSNLKGGKTGSMTVKLSGKAGSQGDIVALNSSNPAISVPATVIVPSGATSVNFAFTSVAVSKTIAVQVSATLGTSKVISSVIVTK